ncbi:GSCOCG00006312001-RA-CDS [Cotesia congregata]|nr:GSCOCG00006312001-RA-CDS [Cotesia congregata]
MSSSEFIATDTIDGVWPFLQSIEWKDPWLAILLAFHVAVTMTALMTRNHANFQIILFLILLLLVYFSESINEVAASKWMLFSKQQYFDSKGLFISIVFSVPILMNCMIMVVIYKFLRQLACMSLKMSEILRLASWLYQSSQLTTNLKRAQLRQRAKIRQTIENPPTTTNKSKDE